MIELEKENLTFNINKLIGLEVKSGIYKIISPSNKIYIGQSINIRKRFFTYQRMACKNQPILHNSFLKYGVKNHNFSIVEFCDVENLNIRERHWQDFYDVIGINGLNCLLQETSNNSREISEYLRSYKSRIIVELNLKKKENIYQYDFYGNLIKKWNNSSEIKIEYPDINLSALSKCLNNMYKTWHTYGFIWKKDELLTNEQLLICQDRVKIKDEDRIIVQYDLKGNVIREWKNKTEIHKTINVQVLPCVSGKVSNTVGFIWKYKKDNFDITNYKLGKLYNKREKITTPIYQYNKVGELIKIWETLDNVKEKPCIMRCVSEKRNSFKDSVWSKRILEVEEIISKFETKSKPVGQYTMEKVFIKKWDSGKQIRRSYNIAMVNLKEGEFINKKGFLWKLI